MKQVGKASSTSVYLQPEERAWLKRHGKSASRQLRLDLIALQEITNLINGTNGDCELGKQIRWTLEGLVKA